MEKISLIGYIDIIGNFFVNTDKFYISDGFNEENLNFFYKFTYKEKLKEFNDSLVQCLLMLKQINEIELNKFRIQFCSNTNSKNICQSKLSLASEILQQA